MRADHGLPTLLRYENIAWYDEEAAHVRLLDRRVYPRELRYVDCSNPEEVRLAIQGMVTQSYGPFTAAAMAMALAARSCQGQTESKQLAVLQQAAERLATARPTTEAQMRAVVEDQLAIARQALTAGESRLDLRLKNAAIERLNQRYTRIERQGEILAELFPQNGRIMTQCFADTMIGMMLRAARRQNKNVEFYCPETRPFYQGSRLTASCIAEMGFPVTVITDNMPGYVLKAKSIDLFTSAADVITGDGHVINKIGTFQIALACHYHDIPYYVSGDPDPRHPTAATVCIEERNPREVLESLGCCLTLPEVQGYYPAFDLTPPELVRGVISSQGLFRPDALSKFCYS